MSMRRSAKDGKDRRHTLLTRLIGRMSVLSVIALKAGRQTLARRRPPLHNPNSS
jgi:hypothetical protein